MTEATVLAEAKKSCKLQEDRDAKLDFEEAVDEPQQQAGCYVDTDPRIQCEGSVFHEVHRHSLRCGPFVLP